MGKVEKALEEGILLLRMNRPEALNALDDEMVESLVTELEHVAEDDGIAGVILTGTGRAFCAGADLSRFEGVEDPRSFRWRSHRLTRLVELLESVEKPVVAALNGLATGIGVALALAADMRIASSEAYFAYREGRIGLLPNHGGLARLIRYVGLGRARDILLGGEELDASRALSYGLVTEVVPPDVLLDAARSRLRKALERAPLSYGLVKRLLVLAGNVDLGSMLLVEAIGQSQLVFTEDHREGIRAAREKRRPIFRGQ